MCPTQWAVRSIGASHADCLSYLDSHETGARSYSALIERPIVQECRQQIDGYLNPFSSWLSS